jgi:tyrosyl-tRNA synthetase
MNNIEELLTRGVDKIYPSKEEFEKVLKSGKTLTIYQGFDPTGSQLHIGHMMGLLKLRDFQEAGHKVIFLIGDFTGMIGDPSGKTTARKVLTHEEVLGNAKNYKEQAARILKFEGENAVEVKFNGEWLSKMSAFKFLEIAHLLSVNQVVERDMFQERQKNGEEIYMNEFLYPVMQAYDSVEMKVDVEIGGTDQMFNMLMGRKLMRHILHKDKYVITVPLLTDSEGKKIGKTEGNVIGLTDKPNELFAKLMTLPDDITTKCFEYLTRIPLTKIDEIKKENEQDPIAYKKAFAYELVKFLNNEQSAMEAKTEYEKVNENKELPTEIPTFTIKQKETLYNLADLIVATGLVSSKGEAKRLIEQGGVELDNEKMTEPNQEVDIKDNAILKVGKRKFIQIIVE